MTTNGRVGVGKGTKPEDPLSAFKHLGKDVMEGFKAAIDEAMNKSLAIREAEAKFGAPGTAGIAVRREGILQRENPEDRKRYEALKANRDRKVLSAHHIKDLGAFIVSGQEYVLDVADHLSNKTDALPDHLKPLGQALTQAGVQILSGVLIESAKHNAETGFLEITAATPPGQHQQ